MANFLKEASSVGNALYDIGLQVQKNRITEEQLGVQREHALLYRAQTGNLLQKMDDERQERAAMADIDISQYDNPYEPLKVAAEKATNPRVKANLMVKYGEARNAHFDRLTKNLMNFKEDSEVFNQVLQSDAYKDYRKWGGIKDGGVVNLKDEEQYYTHKASPDNPLETPKGIETEGLWDVKEKKGKVVQWLRKDKEDKKPYTISYERGDQHITEIYENGKLVRTETGPRYKPPGPPKTLTPQQLGEKQASLRKEFNNLPEIKEYNMTRNKITAMEAAYQESKKTNNFVATDQAMITLFNKMTDPNSVVRESEYERTGVNLPLINQIKGKIAKIGKGGAGLTHADREAIMKMGRLFDSAQKSIYRKRAEEYRGYATESHLNPDSIAKIEKVDADPLGIR